MKKNIKYIVLIAAAVLLIAAVALVAVFQDALFSVPTTDSYSFINPDESRAETDEGMIIDGVLDESVYSQNTWTYLHNANGGNTVDVAITSYFGEKGIYFAYEVRENTPIYVNMDRATWMNSCIEMYLVSSDVQSMPSENVFEIDLLPTGYLLFKRPNAAGGWSDVSTVRDKMAYLGATTHGGEVNTDSCTGYNLELFIPYDYLEHLGVDPQLVKNGYVNVNPCHITAYNETGTDGSVDRFWYSFATQLGGDGWNDINRFFKFNKDGAMGTVKNEFAQAQNCTLSGNPTAIPGQNTTVTVTPDAGYAISSITCNDKEMLRQVNYNEDGTVTLTVRAGNEGLRFAAEAEQITQGNKTLMGVVELKNIFGDTLEGVSASYKDASGEHKLELAEDGSFTLENIPQGYYVIRVKKDGYLKAERTLCVNRNLDIAVDVLYDLFEAESGNCWKTEDANEGVLTKINGTGSILTKELFGDFYVEANLSYSRELAEEFPGDDYLQQRMGIRVKFDNEKYWHIDLLRQNDGKYHLQFGKILGEDSLFNWDLIHELTKEQIARYQSDAGIKLGVLRAGKTGYIYLDNVFVGKADLGAAQTNAKAQVGFESFTANGQVMTVPFKLDVTAPGLVALADQGSTGARVSLGGTYSVGQDIVLLIHKTSAEDGAKLLSVMVNGKEMAQDAVQNANGYKLTVSGNMEKILSVKAVYAKPSKTNAVIHMLDSDADGVNVRLVQDGEVRATAVIHNGNAVFSDIDQGTYSVQANIFNIWTHVDRVTVLGGQAAQADIKGLFETPKLTNYTGNLSFQGTTTKHYSIATDISGDAWFAMKLQLDKAKLEAVKANHGNVRLGYRMFFGGYEGNYEWDNEYEITLKYTAEGKWVLEQMQTWQSYELPEQMVHALTGDGLHLALHRDAATGALTLYYGSSKMQLLAGENACKWEAASQKQKENIRRFGVGFWSENGSDYAATVSDLRYGTDLSQLLGIHTVSATVQLSGRKLGVCSALTQGTPVLLQGTVGSYELTADENGCISAQVIPGTYILKTAGYMDAEVVIPDSGLDTPLTLEYDLFYSPTGWDTEKHDLSKINLSDPQILMDGGTMNVLTNDYYAAVSASLWVKESNSTHSAHTQGIWVRFEDGKYMILYQEDDKLAYMDKLWDFETVLGSWQSVSPALPENVLSKWKADGYALTLLRNENRLHVTVDAQLYHELALPAAYADDQVQVGFFSYDSTPGAAWKFAISGELPEFTVTRMTANISVEDGTPIRLIQAGEIKAQGTMTDNCFMVQDLPTGSYDVQMQIFGCWVSLHSVENPGVGTVNLDLASVFENPDFADFDGDITFAGTEIKHCSVAADIAGDAWFAMRVQVDKAKLASVAANKGNIRLGYRMFFGGEPGNYLWENEYEITLKYTQNGWIMEQMNTWEGWDRTLSQAAVDALTGDGLYLVLHRNAETGVLTLYYGATQAEVVAGANSFTYTQATGKHKETITRFGAGFWSENGSDYTAVVSDLCYGATLEEALKTQ